jgi:hypothetical protein
MCAALETSRNCCKAKMHRDLCFLGCDAVRCHSARGRRPASAVLYNGEHVAPCDFSPAAATLSAWAWLESKWRRPQRSA